MAEERRESESESVDDLVREARANWGNTTDHERLQATGQAERHLEETGDEAGAVDPAPAREPDRERGPRP